MALSPEQITQLRTQAGMSATPPPPTAPQTNDVIAARKAALGVTPQGNDQWSSDSDTGFSGLVKNVKAGFDKRVGEAGQAQEDALEGKQSDASAALQTLGAGAKFIVSDLPVALAKSIIKPDKVNALQQNIESIPETKMDPDIQAKQDKFKADLAALAEKHPEAVKNLDAGASLLSLIPGAKGVTSVIEGAGPKLEEGFTAQAAGAATNAKNVKTAAGAAVGAVKKVVAPVKEALSSAAKQSQTALQRVTPDLDAMSPTAKEKFINSTLPNSTPRMTEGTAFGKRTVNNTKTEIAAAKELESVPGYNDKLTNLEAHNVTKSEIAARARDLRTSLASEKVIVPKREVYAAVKDSIDSLPEESLLLQSADPAITNYTRVLQNVMKKEPGTLEGVLNMKQALDDAYENARGRLAYPGGEEKLGALDEVHTAARDTLTQYLIDHAVSTDAKAGLKAQWLLYKADDELVSKAAREASTGAGRFMQAHPTITKVAKVGAQSMGIGATLHLLP